MSCSRMLLAVLVIAACPTASWASGQDLGKREQLILHVLDTNGDQIISCQELAAFLNPAVIQALRNQGVEPRVTSRVPACGPRTKPGPTPENLPDRSPEQNYEEFFRELIKSALNTATSVSADDAVEPREILELEGTPLPSPLTGTIGDLLPTLSGPIANGGESWVDVLAKWIQVRQSFLDDAGIGKPAKLSWTNHGAGDETLDPGDPSHVFDSQRGNDFEPAERMDAMDRRERPSGGRLRGRRTKQRA